MNDITAVLNHIKEEITSNISRPNLGGCAVIAALVGLQLRKHTEVEVLIENWHGAYDIVNIKSNHNTKEFNDAGDWHNAGLYFPHVRLKFQLNGKMYAFDSDDGITEYNPKAFCNGSLTVDECKVIAGKDIGWNGMFDRSQIIDVARIVRRAFGLVPDIKLAEFCGPIAR